MSLKSDNFTRLAEKRVNTVLDKMRLIGNLADERYYEYSDNQANKIIKSLKREIRDIENKFKTKNKADTQRFTFK